MSEATPTDDGGYDYDFVNRSDKRYDDICNICHLPSRDPYMTGECCRGQIICKSCLDRALKISKSCPICRNETERFVTYPNFHLDREIKSLLIYCTNKNKGCEWQGELSDINHHLSKSNGCQFEEVKCSNECGETMQRQYLIDHIEGKCPRREIHCKHCYEMGEYQFIEGQHKEECPRLPLPCPNMCEVYTVPREDLKKHIDEECQLEVLDCLNNCGMKFERRNLCIHSKTQCRRRKVKCQHCNVIGEHCIIEGKHQEVCPKILLSCPNGCSWFKKISREDMEVHRKSCSHEEVLCEYHKVGYEERMIRKNQEKHNNEKMKEHLMMTQKKLNITSAQLADTNTQLTSALNQISNLTILVHSLLNSSVTARDADALSVPMISVAKWSVQLDAMAEMSKLVVDQECPVTIKLTKFKKLNKDKMSWHSNPFYTHNKGYKMCLKIHAAGYGNGKGTHISVFLFLMKGPHDDELTWPMREKLEIRLMNQISNGKHHIMVLPYDDETPDDCTNPVKEQEVATGGSGSHQFISNEELYKITQACQYLKNDCIIFQILKV